MNTETNTKTTPYAVVVVFSKWPLRQLCMFLEDEVGGSREQVGVMRIDRVQGKETNRTIMLVSRSLLEAAEQKGFTQSQKGLDFKMTEYELRDFNRPKQGQTRNFYVPLPEELSATDATAQLENKLEVLCNFGMFAKDRPRVKIHLLSRESEKHKGQAFVTFSRNSDDDEVALARVLLHETKLYTGENDYTLMKCLWAKERAGPKSPRSPKDQKGKDTKGRGPMGKRDQKNPKEGLKNGTRQKQAKPLRKAPARKELVKDQTAPTTVAPLEAGENKWDKPLTETVTGLAPLPPLNVTSSTETHSSEDSPKESNGNGPTPPTGLDFPPLH